MLSSLSRLFAGVMLLTVLWSLSLVRTASDPIWVHPLSAKPGPVRILRFYASTGTLAPGETAQLCYSVENAKIIRISPLVDRTYPSLGRCVDIRPEHTTHYTLQAEGFDGTVAVRSVTLAVHDQAIPTSMVMQVAVRSFQLSAIGGQLN
jgi:hypothetical protein